MRVQVKLRGRVFICDRDTIILEYIILGVGFRVKGLVKRVLYIMKTTLINYNYNYRYNYNYNYNYTYKS
jgi:hypothetical protein